ncbi:MAG: mechanosensitive ion channel [Cetobacterium sp.]|uniref:mechanosensitive ion channel n=1 Tax=Cetobacterium sp. TaxID=2071632 RepID=UPI002FC71523
MEHLFTLWSNNYIFNIIIALVIIILGLWFASYVAKKIESLFSKTKIFGFLEDKIIGGEDSRNRFILGFFIKFIYYIIVIFVIIAAAERLGFSQFTTPLVDFLTPIFSFIPNVFGGILLLIVAVITAKFAKYFSEEFLKKLKVDDKIKVSDNSAPISHIIGEIVYLIVFILLLPGILVSLKLNGILTPITDMTNKFLSYIPNIIASGLILLVGWFIASKLRNIIKGILDSFNLDNKIVVDGKSIFQGKLSSIISTIIYILILIPVITASLGYLGLQYITLPIINMLDILFQYIPNLVGVAIVITLAFYFGKLFESVVTNILIGLKFDSYIEKTGIKVSENNYSKLAGKAVKIIVVYFAIIQSIEILSFGTLSTLSLNLTLLLGQILLGVIIIGVGVFLAKFASNFILNTEMANKKSIAVIAKVAIIIFVGAMGLRQMGIANEIINLAFGFTVGALAVAFAVAFGIGGKDLAKEKLENLKKCCNESKNIETPEETEETK